MTITFGKIKPLILALAIVIGYAAHCGQARAAGTEKAYFAGGCFWCVESDFEKVKGVKEVISGFTGGHVANPSYEQVSHGGTGHYESVEIRYDPGVVSYQQLVHLFFRSIDPTDAGGQFCDRGSTYRTAIFVTSPAQRQVAEAEKAAAQKELGKTVVTDIQQVQAFYPAGDYHQDYYKSHDKILTRFGYIQKKDAYKKYRTGCGRDQRVRQLWGPDAPFVS